MLLLLLWLWLCVAQVIGDEVSSCKNRYKNLEKGGQMMGLILIVDPGGPLDMSVTITFKPHMQANFGGIWMKEDNLNGTNILRYYLKFPDKRSLPKITEIKFNKWNICTTEVPQYTSIVTTSLVHAIKDRKTETSLLNVESGLLTSALPSSVKPTKTQKKEHCGISIRPQKLMIGARDVERGDWPWVATLYDVHNPVFKCAGSLVAKRFVIIAAHCVVDSIQQTKMDEDKIVVIMGRYDFSKWVERAMQAREVRRIIVHPDFSSDPLTNDLALLYLEDDVEFTMYAKPICLFDEKYTVDTQPNQVGTLIGWNPGEILQRRALAPIVSHKECLSFAGTVASHTFCAGNTTASKNCIGDSEGGLFLPKLWENGNVRWFLRGIPSNHLQNDLETCAKGGYVVYTDAAQYTTWIREVVTTTRPYDWKSLP